MSAPSLAQRVDWTGGFRCATDQAVLKAMARWFCYRADGTCRPFTVPQLAAKAGVPKRSADRGLARLAEDWRIEVLARIPGSRQPTRYRIVVARLATEDPDALNLSGSCATVARDRDLRAPQWRVNTDGSDGNIKNFEEVARSSTEEEVRTERSERTATPSTGARPEHADVARFLDWARITYPEHAKGAQFEMVDDRRRYVVHVLLEHYGLERLQAMAVVCWTIQADGDPASHATWIAHSDRSLYVLKHKAPFLDRVVVGAQQLELGPLTPDARPERVVDYIARTLAEARATREQTG